MKKALFFLIEATKIKNNVYIVNVISETLYNLAPKTFQTIMTYEYTNTSQERKEFRYALLTLAFCSHIFDYSKYEYLADCQRLGLNFYNRGSEEIAEYHQVKLQI